VLESMQIPNLGDFILFSIASRCLTIYSIKLFEAQLANGFPMVKELLTFIKSRVAVLECIPREHSTKYTTVSRPVKNVANHLHQKQSQHIAMFTGSNSQPPQSCKCCKGAHLMSLCRKFKDWFPEVRHSWVRENHLCFRCLRTIHRVPKCRSSVVCDKCSRKHHPLLHSNASSDTQRNRSTSGPSHSSTESTTLLGHLSSHSVLLGIALVHIRDRAEVLQTVRAIVDSNSQISAITSTCSSRLGLRLSKWTAPVTGLSGATVHGVQRLVDCQIQPSSSYSLF